LTLEPVYSRLFFIGTMKNTKKLNYRVKARQNNIVTDDLARTWAFLRLPSNLMPTDEKLASVPAGEWYLFLEQTNEYIDVCFTRENAGPDSSVFNKFGKY